MPDFATRLRELRLARGLRQKDLALALGLAQTTIANYEQKLRFPDEPTLVQVADYFAVSLDDLLGRGGDPRPPSAGEAGMPAPALGGLAGEYFDVLRTRGREPARALLHGAVGRGMGLREIYLSVLTPALREVGRLWAKGEMSVAEEHAFSDATLDIMASLLPEPGAAAGDRPRCVILPAAGEPHSIGARMLANLLGLEGVDVRFAAGTMSLGHAREMLVGAPPALLALSVTLRENVAAAADAIAFFRLRRELAGMKIMVGGPAFAADPDLWRRVGADATAGDAAEGVRTALVLLGLAQAAPAGAAQTA